MVYIGIAIVVGYLIWVGSGALEAFAEVKSMPREPMEWCPKGHGFFRKKHVLTFMGVTVCPRCYLEAWRNAGEKK